MQNAPLTNRSKHSVFFSETGFYNTFDRRLSPTEDLFLDKLLVALENINSTLTYKFKRMKRYSILTWVLGWVSFQIHAVLTKLKRI